MGNHLNLHFSAPNSRHERGSTSSTESSGVLSSKNHKHFHAHNHVDTPYPVLEETATNSSSSTTSSTGSFLEVHKHDGKMLLSHIPNPMTAAVHIVEDHVVELRYGHTSRQAKRDARKLSQASSKPWQIDAEMLRTMSIPEADEIDAQEKEEMQKAWEAELTRRQLASRSCTEIAPVTMS